jgi:hypothetical protein
MDSHSSDRNHPHTRVSTFIGKGHVVKAIEGTSDNTLEAPRLRGASSSMNRKMLLLLAAGGPFLLSWTLPVIDAGGVYTGWEAFRFALSPIWPYDTFNLSDDLSFGEMLSVTLMVASGLTNIVFVLVWGEHVLLRRHASRRRVVWALAAATVLNCYWFLWEGLMAGYYVWLVSFPVLALAAWQRRPKVNT